MILFGERQPAPGITTEPLAQAVVPTRLVGRPSAAFVTRMRRAWRQEMRLSLPRVGVDGTSPIHRGQRLPGEFAGVLGAVTDGESDDLARPPTLRRPEPALEEFRADEGHPFVYLQHLLGLSRPKRLCQRGQRGRTGFQPAPHRPAPDAEPPLQAAQTYAPSVGAQNLCPLLGAVTFFRSKHAVDATILAVILRIAALVRPIAYHVGAAA